MGSNQRYTPATANVFQNVSFSGLSFAANQKANIGKPRFAYQSGPNMCGQDIAVKLEITYFLNTGLEITYSRGKWSNMR